jgi:hypothetical protein
MAEWHTINVRVAYGRSRRARPYSGQVMQIYQSTRTRRRREKAGAETARHREARAQLMRRVSGAQQARDPSAPPRPSWKALRVAPYALDSDKFDGDAHVGPEPVFTRLWCDQETIGVGRSRCIFWPFSLHSTGQRDLWPFDLASLIRGRDPRMKARSEVAP